MFGLGGSTCLVKRVVFGLSLNVSDLNQVEHKPDTQTHFASPSVMCGLDSDPTAILQYLTQHLLVGQHIKN